MATGEDSLAAAKVVESVFQEYGFTWDADDYCADLYDLETHYINLGNPFWIAERGGEIIGTAALEVFSTLPGELGTIVQADKIRASAADCSLERLYVRSDVRGLGLGRALLNQTITEAKNRNRKAMEIWSDKKLSNAHRLYQHFGAISVGERILDDPDNSPEWGFVLKLDS